MSRMPYFLLLILPLLTFHDVKGQVRTKLKPIIKHTGKLFIAVDPRMELLCAAQIQANYPYISKSYNKLYEENKNYFAPYKNCMAVQTTKTLLQEYGFNLDAPHTFMLHLSQPYELKQQIPFSNYLLQKGGNNENLVRYCNELRDFAVTSKFSKYWNKHTLLYERIVNKTSEQLKGEQLVTCLESYFGTEQNSYTIILSPLFNGGKGARLKTSDGKYDLYASIQTTRISNKIPYLDLNDLYFFAWHEFAHSFVNPLSVKYSVQLKKSGFLFSPIAEDMKQQAYSTWEMCVNEHIVRAIVIRMQQIYNNKDSVYTKSAIAEERMKKFIYINLVLDQLKEYEKLHNETKITFEEYYPELLKAFDLSRVDLDLMLVNK